MGSDNGTRQSGLYDLGVSDIVSGIATGRFAAEDVVESCIERVREREPVIGAWEDVDAEYALQQARSTTGQTTLPLKGVPFGVKDVIDALPFRTAMGSACYRSHWPFFDAGCVGLARMRGAIVLGKTVTAEFAGTAPTSTANPVALDRTPGGSSSGSAAAVADRMVPFAFGTQTGGSILRPAAFCGVVGFKPTFGLYSPAGMKFAAHSFDTIGLIARSAEDVAIVHAALMSDDVASSALAPPRVGVFRSHLWDTVDADCVSVLAATAARFSSCGASVVPVEVPPWFGQITQQRAVVNAYERARGLVGEWQNSRDSLSPQTLDVCERGFKITGQQYVAARRDVELFRRQAMLDLFEDVDVLLAPTTPGEAPHGKGYPGDPRLQELWTTLHMPSITLPAGQGGHGLPIGIQLVGAPFVDQFLLSAARWAERLLNE